METDLSIDKLDHMVLINEALLASSSILERLKPAEIFQAFELIREAFKSGNKVMICGNGGSAAQAQHLAAELVGHYAEEREALPAIALSTDTSILTAVANDYGYKHVFSRQIRALASDGDVLIAFSTSGNSMNVLLSMSTARGMNMKVIGLTGNTGGDMHPGIGDLKFDQLCHVCIKVPHNYTPLIQQAHLVIGHIFCELLDAELE